MANPFRITSADPDMKDVRDRELRLAKRQADPGYQFLNAGLSTIAKTLGSLAVNAAS